jgi:hypothetical protein
MARNNLESMARSLPGLPLLSPNVGYVVFPLLAGKLTCSTLYMFDIEHFLCKM